MWLHQFACTLAFFDEHLTLVHFMSGEHYDLFVPCFDEVHIINHFQSQMTVNYVMHLGIEIRLCFI